MSELEDMMKDERIQQSISDKLLEKSVQERNIRLILTEQIYSYLRKNNKKLWELNREDLNNMTENYAPKYQQRMMQQVMKALRTNRWKPISWIKENHKSILLDELD